ncbi:hypothetical protein ABK040_014637 [Willaertia magna]
MSQQNNNSLSSTSSSPLNTSSSSSFNKDNIEKQIEEWKNKYLNKYNCPISQQLMIDPVTIETGQTYDRKTIEEWLKSKNTCPITRATLKNNNLIEKLFNNLESDEFKLDILIILFNKSNYNRNNLLKKLLNININENNNKFITFFKNLFKEINLNEIDLNEIDLNELIEFISDYKNDLQNELIIIYKELYKKNNEIKYLEIIYDLNNENKEIEQQLLNEYLKLNLMDKYFNLFIKTNENKLDSFNLMLLKCLQNQNKEIINLQLKI